MLYWKIITTFKSFVFSIPDGRWFILVVGKGHFMLATLMEAGGCTEDVSHSLPLIYYI